MALLLKTSYRAFYLYSGILLCCCVLLSAATGAVHLSLTEIVNIIQHKSGVDVQVNPVYEGLFFQIRLPRTMLCLLVGASLSVSGTLMQALFRNPIVEPGLIGTSSGSAFGAALVIVFGGNAFLANLGASGELFMPLFAFAGGLIATFLVYYFSASWNRVNISIMILAGIAINAMANGATGFLAYIARDPQARSITSTEQLTSKEFPPYTSRLCHLPQVIVSPPPKG